MSRKYIVVTEMHSKGKPIISKGCNAILFRNVGTTTATVEGETLAPGQVIANNGLEGEEDQTTYKLRFANNQAAGNNVAVRMKFYQKD